MKTDVDEILNSVCSIKGVTLDVDQRIAAKAAMNTLAQKRVNQFRDEQNRFAIKESFRLIPALWKGEFMLWLRKRSFEKAKKQADTLAKIENRPFYVIRKTETAYVVQSTLEARTLRKRRIYARNVNSVKLQETADYTAYPR